MPGLETADAGEATQHFALGRRFGRYESLIELASGGMGTVTVARLRGPNRFKRLVAIKTLHPHLSRDENYAKLFLREADIASKLHHPNVVPVLELGEEAGVLYQVMEYFPSQPLSLLLKAVRKRGEKVPYGIAIAIVADAAAALDAAHKLCDSDGALLDLVHRDATPSNFLVGEDGSVKLTDFGVAKAMTATHDSLTGETGAIRGKWVYLSPEQITSESLDRRSDLWTLGTVLWEVTVGERLFKGESELGIVKAILETPLPDPRDKRPDYPDRLRAILMKLLTRDPAQRYQTAEDVRRDLLEELREYSSVDRGAYVRNVLGPALDARRSEVAAAEVALDSAPREPGSTDSGRRSATDSTGASSALRINQNTPAAAAIGLDVDSDGPGSRDQAGARRRRVVYAVAAALAIVLVTVFAMRSGNPPAGAVDTHAASRATTASGDTPGRADPTAAGSASSDAGVPNAQTGAANAPGGSSGAAGSTPQPASTDTSSPTRRTTPAANTHRAPPRVRTNRRLVM